MSLAALWEGYRTALVQEMAAVFAGRRAGLFDMMRYHLGWADAQGRAVEGFTGKGLRPFLCLLVCESVGGDVRQALPAAAALELLHKFTLVHDDIQDRSLHRWGRDTVWSLWGMEQAINVGDGLFALAHLSLARLTDVGVPPERVLEAFRLFDETTVRLCEGQYLDLSFEDRDDVTLADYLAMVSGKTAALIGTAVEMGALVGGAAQPTRRALREFGEALGMAFQMQDDILGLWGSEAVTGKPAGSDILQRKKSLPIVWLLEHGDAAVRDQLRLLYRAAEPEADRVEHVMALLNAGTVQEECQALVRDQFARGLRALQAAGLSAEGEARLRLVVQDLIVREF